MKRNNLSYYYIDLPMVEPFVYSEETEVSRRGYILELNADGITAYSECVTNDNPFYSYEDNDTALHIISHFLVKHLLDLPYPEDFIERVKYIKGHNMAKAALEMLLWDYWAKQKKIPLYKFIGGSKEDVNAGISIGIDSPEKMVKKVENAVNEGYKRIKVKISKGNESSILSAIRDAFPSIPLSADANSSYRMSDLNLLKKIDKYNLLYLEQPLDSDDILYHSRLRREISTPVCLDESITSIDKMKKAVEIEALDVLNIKPGRVGGIYNSLEIAKIATENKIHVWIGGMEETGVGLSYNVSLATLKYVDYTGDLHPTSRWFEKDIVSNPLKMIGGMMKLQNGYGIGADLDREYLKKITKSSGHFSLIEEA